RGIGAVSRLTRARRFAPVGLPVTMTAARVGAAPDLRESDRNRATAGGAGAVLPGRPRRPAARPRGASGRGGASGSGGRFDDGRSAEREVRVLGVDLGGGQL